MTFFTEQMKALADDIRNTGQKRANFLTGVHERTEGLLSEARSFVQHLEQEHRTRTEELRNALGADRRQRFEQLETLRRANRQQRQALRRGIEELLDQARNNRRQQVHSLLRNCQETQQRLVHDLRQAGRIWRELTQTRA